MKKKTCFFSQMYQAIPSLVAVQNELGGTFVSGRKSTVRYFKHNYPELGFSKFNKRFKWFNVGHKAMLNAGCIVTGSPYRGLLSPYSAKKVMVFHGTYAGLTFDALNGLKHFDHLFLIGERMERMLLRNQRDHAFNYTKTGFIPFSHFLDKNELNRKNVLEPLGLDPSLKTVVYCPSRRGVGSWELCAENLIKEISSDYNLVLRPHPSQSMNLRWHERASMRAIKEGAGKRTNTIVDLVDVALPDLLMVADLLISDANSPSEEALYYDSPQLLTGLGNSSLSEIEKSLVVRNMSDDDLNDVLKIFNCAPVYATGNYINWNEAVETALLQKDDFKKNREANFRSIFGQRDKNAGKRVADIIRTNYL